MTGPSPARDDAFAEKSLPRSNGELIFEHPWQARALAMAVLLVERTGCPWDDFRRRLVAAIDDKPGRPYWENWVVALESLATDSLPRLLASGQPTPTADRGQPPPGQVTGRRPGFSSPPDS